MTEIITFDPPILHAMSRFQNLAAILVVSRRKLGGKNLQTDRICVWDAHNSLVAHKLRRISRIVAVQVGTDENIHRE